MILNKKSVFYNGFLLSFSAMFLQILSFVYRIIMSRITNAETIGVFHLVMQVYGMISAFCLSGLTLAVSTLSSKAVETNNNGQVKLIVKSAKLIFTSLFLLSALPVIIFREYISDYMLGNIKTVYGIVLILPCLFLTGIENLYKNCFYGINKVVPTIISEISEQVIRIVAMCTLFYILKPVSVEVSVAVIICGMIISEIFSAVILNFFFKKEIRNENSHSRDSYTGKILTIAIPIAISGLFTNILSSANSVLIPNRLVSYGYSTNSAMEIFGVLFGMTVPLLMLPIAFIMPLGSVLISKISGSLAVNNLAEVRRKIGKAIQVTSIISCEAMGLMSVLGKDIAISIYKNNSAGDYIVPLSFATLFVFFAILTTNILNIIGCQKQSGAIILLTGIIQLALTLILIPKLGVVGYIVADGVVTFIQCIFNFAIIINKTGLKIMVQNWFITPIISAVLSALTARIMILTNFTILTSALCGIIMFFTGLGLLGINPIKYLKSVTIKSKA